MRLRWAIYVYLGHTNRVLYTGVSGPFAFVQRQCARKHSKSSEARGELTVAPFSQCQQPSTPIEVQLLDGIRYFDVRLRVVGDELLSKF
jgi:hypothetical protein